MTKNATAKIWRITVQLGLGQLVAWGVLYYSFAVYLPEMIRDLGWSKTSLTGGFALGILVSGFVSPFVGKAVDRYGPREIMVAGVLFGSLGVLSWGLATSLETYFLSWGLIGLGMAGSLYEPAFAAVVRLAPDTSNRNVLVISMIGSFASTVFLPLGSSLAELYGWRAGLVVLSVVLLVLCGALNGFLPAVPAPSSLRDVAIPSSDQTVERRFDFGVLAVALMLANAVSVTFHAFCVSLLILNGSQAQTAAVTAGLAGVAQLCGRMTVAAGLQRVRAIPLLKIALFMQGIVLIVPLLYRSYFAGVVMVIVFGFGAGAKTLLRPAAVVEVFGASGFGKRNGSLQIPTTIAKAAAIMGTGMALDLVGPDMLYTTWGILSLVIFLAGLLLFLLRTTRP